MDPTDKAILTLFGLIIGGIVLLGMTAIIVEGVS